MFRTKGSTGDVPTWEALREPSVISGDADSDTDDELDQIRATPAPISRLDRPVYKRKESDWKIEPVPKRAKHEPLHNARDNSVQGNTVGSRSASSSEAGALGDSGSDRAPYKNSTISGKPVRSSPSMFPPPLPSRVKKDVARKHSTLGQPSLETQSISTTRSIIPSMSTPMGLPPRGKDIPSSLDSVLFSSVSARLGTQLQLQRSSKAFPDPKDVIEISSETSDTPPSALTERDDTTPFTSLSSAQKPIKELEKKKTSAATHEVIEIIDSDEERGMQTTSSQLLRTPISRAPRPQKRTPTTLRMRTMGKSPSSAKLLKSPVPDRSKPVLAPTESLSNPTPRPASSLVQQVTDQSSFSASPTQSRFSQTGLNPMATSSSEITEKAPAPPPLSAGHAQKMSGIFNASEEASKSASVSDNGDINMHDINFALGIPLPSKKGKSKEDVPSTVLGPTRKVRLFARKCVGGRPPRRQLSIPGPVKPIGGLGYSAASAIDLTSDASDGGEVNSVSKSGPSKNKNSSTSPTISDPGRATMLHSPSLSPKTSALPVATAPSIPPESVVSPESNQPPLNSETNPPLELNSLKASEVPIPSDQTPPPSGSPSSPGRSQLQTPSRSPDVLMSTNLPLSTGPEHKSTSTSPLIETRHQLVHSFSESVPTAADSGSSSSSPSSISQPPFPERNTTHVPFPLVPTDIDETLSQAFEVLLPQTALKELRLSSESDVAEKLLIGNDSDDAMRDAGELDAVVGGGTPSMDEEPPVSDNGMWIDGEAERPSAGLVQSQFTVKTTRPSAMSLGTSSDSGVEASSSEPGRLNSPVSVPSTRRSSRLSLYSHTSEDADVQRRSLHSMPSSRSTSPDDIGRFKFHSSTLGGFPAYRFESYRKDPNNFPKVYYAADLPSSIQDHINNQPEDVRMLSEIRDVFEAMILENTADDERDAPPILIQNNVDEEPTPPWEFWYSNKMWHGKGVPDPDVKNLKGCDCRGACNPKNKACACAQRQCQVIGDKRASEFAYDKNGKLKYPGFPIFECNNTCWCGPECANRVVQHGRKTHVAIRKTLNKGWGVFNGPKRIPPGTFIGIYAGELLTDEEAHRRGLKYNKAGTTYLFDLDFHHLKEGPEEEWSNLYTVDAYHAGNFTRFLNHSCNPNCRLYPCYINEGDIQKPLLVVFSIRDIGPEEEICFNYQGVYPGEEDDEDEPQPDEDGDEPKDKIYTKCLCGAKNCRGVMFS